MRVRPITYINQSPDSRFSSPNEDMSKELNPYMDYTDSNINELEAIRENTFGKLGQGALNAALKATSEIGNTPGYLFGLGEWASTGFDTKQISKSFDNDWIRAFESLNEDNKADVYVPQSVRDGGFWDKISSASYWGTDVSDGLGFMGGMMLTSMGLSSLSLGSAAMKVVDKGIKGFSAGVFADAKAIQSGLFLGKTGQLTSKGLKIAEGVDQATRVAFNTHKEAALEAKGVYDKIFLETGNEELASKEALGNYGVNLAILGVSNYIFDNAFIKDRLGKVSKNAFGNSLENKIADAVINNKKNLSNWTKGKIFTGKILTNTISEGFWEEGMQLASENYWTKRGLDAAGGKLIPENESVLKGVLRQYWDNVGTSEYAGSVLAGAILGFSGGVVSAAKDYKTAKKAITGLTELGKNLMNVDYSTIEKIYKTEIDKDGKENFVRNADGKREVDRAKLSEFIKHNDAISIAAAIKEANQNSSNSNIINDMLDDAVLFSKFIPYYQYSGGVEILERIIDNKTKDDKTLNAVFGSTENTNKYLKDKMKRFGELFDYANKLNNNTFKLKAPKDVNSNEFKAYAKTKQDHYSTIAIQLVYQDNIKKTVEELNKQVLKEMNLDMINNEQSTLFKTLEKELEEYKSLLKDLNEYLEFELSEEAQNDAYKNNLAPLNETKVEEEAKEAAKTDEQKTKEAFAQAAAETDKDLKTQITVTPSSTSPSDDDYFGSNETGESDTQGDSDPNSNISGGDILATKFDITNGQILSYIANPDKVSAEMQEKIKNYLDLQDGEHIMQTVFNILSDKNSSIKALEDLKKQAPELLKDPKDALALKALNIRIDAKIKDLKQKEAEEIERNKPINQNSIFTEANVLSRVIRTTETMSTYEFNNLVRDIPEEQILNSLIFKYSKNTTKQVVSPINDKVSRITPTHMFNVFYQDKKIGFVPGYDSYLFNGELVTSANIDTLVGPVNFTLYFSKEEKYDVFKEMLTKQTVLNNNLQDLLSSPEAEVVTLGYDYFKQFADVTISSGELAYRTEADGNIKVTDLQSEDFNYFEGNYVVVQNNIDVVPGQKPFRVLDPIPVIFKADKQAKLLKTSDIQDEIIEELEKLKNRDRLGRYLLAVKLGNGKIKFIHLKAPKLANIDKLIIDKLNSRLGKTRQENTYISPKDNKVTVKDNAFNEEFNSLFNESFMIALPEGFDMKLNVSPSGNITVITSYKAQRGAKNSEGKNLDKNSVYSVKDLIEDDGNLVNIIKRAYMKALQDHSELIDFDTMKTFTEFTSTIKASNIVQGIPKELNSTIISGLTTSVNKAIVKNGSINIVGNKDFNVDTQEKLSVAPKTDTTPTTEAKKPESKSKKKEKPVEVDINVLELSELKKQAETIARKARKSKKDKELLIELNKLIEQKESNINNNDGIDSTVLDLTDVTNSGIEKDKAYLQAILPDFISVQELDTIYNRFIQNRAISLGRFENSVIYLGKNRKSTTKQHEAFHAVFRMLLSDTQINSLINEAKQLKKFTKEEIANFKFNRPKYESLDDVELSNIMYEEYLAEGFEKWTKDRQFRTGNLIKAFYKRLSDIVKNLTGKQSEIEATYKNITSGKFKKSTIVNNMFSGQLSTVSVDSVVRKTPILDTDNNKYISRTFTSNESNMITSMVYHEYGVLKSNKANSKLTKPQLLELALDNLKNRYGLDTKYYNLSRLSDSEFEQLKDMNFAFNNKQNRESIIKTITKKEKILDAAFTQLEEELDENPIDNANLGGNTSYDFKWEEFGGIGSLSKRTKEYINSIYYFIQDPIDKTKQIPVALNGDKVYSGLIKALSNSSNFTEMLDKMSSYNDGEESQSGKFISEFFKDCDIKYDKETGEYSYGKNGELFHSVLKTFNRYNVLYSHWEVDINKQASRMYVINNIQSVAYQRNIWQRGFDSKYWQLLEDKSIKPEAIKKIKNGMVGALRDFQNAIVNDLTATEIYEQVDAIQKDLKDKLGMELSKNTIKYALLSTKENIQDETLLAFKINFSDKTPIEAEDLNAIATEISKGNNPFIKNNEAVDENEDGVSRIESEGALTRLAHLAYSNSQFDENVYPTSFRNSKDRTVYSFQLPTFHIVRVNELGKQSFRNVLKNSTETSRNLLLQEDAEPFINGMSIERLSGLRAVDYKETESGELVRDKVKDKNKPKTYDEYTDKELASQLLDMWAKQETKKILVGGKVVTKNMALHHIRVLESSSTADLVRLPVIDNLMNTDGTISEKAVNLLYNIFLTEADNIYKANLEIQALIDANALDNDGTPNIPQEEWVARGLPKPIDGYHYKIVNGKLTYENVRGLQFFENSFLEVADKVRNTKSENFTEEFINDVKTAIKTEYENQLKAHLQQLVDLEVLNLNKGTYTSISLLNNFYNVVKEDVKTKEIDTNKIAEFFLNDYLNTYSINNLLFLNENKLFKDSNAQVKRAKGSNAGGPSVETIEKTNYNVAILRDKNVNIIINDTKVGEANSTDAQGYVFDHSLKDLLRGLNKLDAKQEAFIDKLIAGKKLTKEDFFGLEGSITRKGQLISLKLVYNDGQEYYKLSVAILTKNLLYYKDSKGNLLPRREKAELVSLYENAKNKKTDFVIFESASKNAKSFVSKADNLFNNPSEARFWRLQQENPSNKVFTTDPSQTNNLIDSEQDLDLPVYGNVKYRTIREVVRAFQNNTALLKKLLNDNNTNTLFDTSKVLDGITPDNYIDKLNELKNSINNGEANIEIDDFVAQALSTIEMTGGNEQLVEFFTSDNYGKAKYNLNIPSTYDKYVQLLLAHFNNNGFKIKIPGHTATLMSDFGMNVIEHDGKIIDSDDYNNNTSKYANAKFRKLKHNVEVLDSDGNVVSRYSECLFPAHFAELYGLKIGDNQVDSRLLELFGVRIPTQDKHSMVNLRVVGFLPTEMGSTIVVPADIILLSGADFDIDKLYLQRYDFYTNKNGQPVVYGTATTIEGRFEEYKKWMSINNKTVKNKLKTLIKDDIILGTTSDEITEEEFEFILNYSLRSKEDNIKAKRKNELLQEALRLTGLPHNVEVFEVMSEAGEINPGVLYNNIMEAKQILLSNDHIQKKKVEGSNLSIGSTPASLSILKDELAKDAMFKEIWNTKKTTYSASNPIEKVNGFRKIMEGASGIGPIVNFEMIYTILEKNGIRYVDSPLTINGITYDNYGDLYTDASVLNPSKYGRVRKFDIISTLVSAMTDNAKEELASVFRISTDMLPILTHMIMLGANISDALLILNNPIIVEYQNRLKSTKGALRTTEERKDNKAFTLLDDMLAELGGNKSDETENKDENNLEVPKEKPTFALTSQKLLDDAKGTTEDKELHIHLLTLLKELKRTTSLLNNIVQFTNKNKGLSSEIYQFKMFNDAVKDLGLGLNDVQFEKMNVPFDLRAAFTKDMPVLAFYYREVRRLDNTILPYFLLTSSRYFTEMYEALYTNLDVANKHFKLQKDVVKNIVRDLHSYISITAYKQHLRDIDKNDYLEGLTNYDLVYKGENKKSIVDIYKEAKAIDPTNPFLSYITPNPSHLANKKGELVKNPNNRKGINLLTPSAKIENNSDYQTAVMDGFKTLFINPKTKQAAIDIFNYIIVKDGLQYRNESIVNHIANFIFRDFSDSLDNITDKFKKKNLTDIEFREVFGKTKNEMTKEFVDLFTINIDNSYRLKNVSGDIQKIRKTLSTNTRGARFVDVKEDSEYKGKIVIDTRKSIERIPDSNNKEDYTIKESKLNSDDYKVVRKEIKSLLGPLFESVAIKIPYIGNIADKPEKDIVRIVLKFPYRFSIGQDTYRLLSYSNNGKKGNMIADFSSGIFLGTKATYVLDEGFHGTKDVKNIAVTDVTQPLYKPNKKVYNNVISTRDVTSSFTNSTTPDNSAPVEYNEDDFFGEDENFPGEASNSILDVLASKEETTQPSTSNVQKEDTISKAIQSGSIPDIMKSLGYTFNINSFTYEKGDDVIDADDEAAVNEVIEEHKNKNNLDC